MVIMALIPVVGAIAIAGFIFARLTGDFRPPSLRRSGLVLLCAAIPLLAVATSPCGSDNGLLRALYFSLLFLGPALAILMLAFEYRLQARSAAHVITTVAAIVVCVWITTIAGLFLDFTHCIG